MCANHEYFVFVLTDDNNMKIDVMNVSQALLQKSSCIIQTIVKLIYVFVIVLLELNMHVVLFIKQNYDVTAQWSKNT